MPLVVSLVVGSVFAVWLGLFLWSSLRAARASRLRGPTRPESAAPEGTALGIREPEALRAPFAFILHGNLVDVAQSFTGAFRGGVMGVTDLTMRHGDGPPTHWTVATVDVDWRWPWMRLHPSGVEVPPVESDGICVLPPPAGHADWVIEASNTTVASSLASKELLAWLERGGLALQLETTPRHLLVAVEGHLPDERLGELLTLAVGVVDHVPHDVKVAVTPPRPEDDL